MQSSLGQQNIQQPQVVQTKQYNTTPAQPQVQQAYNIQPQTQQGQNLQVPNYSGVNIQIFNPTVAPPTTTAPVYNVNAPNYGTTPVNGCYPSNYYTQNLSQPNDKNINNNTSNSNEKTNTENKKTEKREIVQLTDDYIKNLENYLNSQDKNIRMMGAKEVIARLQEDESRKNDKALNALINKMLQDPYTGVKVLALSALDSGIVSGDNYTVNVLKQMQNSKSGYGQDAMQASNILLKMSSPSKLVDVPIINNSGSNGITES